MSTIDVTSMTVVLAQQPPAQTTANQSNLMLWAAVLLGLAVLLFFLEVFIPSGGIIGMLSVVSMVAGIVMLFRIDTTLGLVGAIVALAALPFLFGFALKIWPHTPIGRMLTLGNPESNSDKTPQASAGNMSDANPKALIGKTGKALTDLRPIGTCLIDGRRVDCIADHGLIKEGTTVRVAVSDGLQIKVIADT